MVDLKLPSINSETEEGKIDQIYRYLIQLIQDLNYDLFLLDKASKEGVGEPSEDASETYVNYAHLKEYVKDYTDTHTSEYWTDRLITKNVTAPSGTAAANTTTNVTFSVAEDGYTALGIVGVNSSSGALSVVVSTLSNATTARVMVRNHTANNVTNFAPIVTVLYLKN